MSLTFVWLLLLAVLGGAVCEPVSASQAHAKPNPARIATCDPAAIHRLNDAANAIDDNPLATPMPASIEAQNEEKLSTLSARCYASGRGSGMFAEPLGDLGMAASQAFWAASALVTAHKQSDACVWYVRALSLHRQVVSARHAFGAQSEIESLKAASTGTLAELGPMRAHYCP
jgi:hypothetical protein